MTIPSAMAATTIHFPRDDHDTIPVRFTSCHSKFLSRHPSSDTHHIAILGEREGAKNNESGVKEHPARKDLHPLRTTNHHRHLNLKPLPPEFRFRCVFRFG